MQLSGQVAIPRLPALGNNAGLVYDSIVQQTRDAIVRAGYSKLTLGLSGGLDSAMAATIAVDALALEGISSNHVHGIIMPSQSTSTQSIDDATMLADRLNISTKTFDIMPTYAAISDTLAPAFMGHEVDVTEENIQARIRGLLLMALSNKFDWLVLAAGNKSESLVGYSTLYGDMVGAFAPLAPLYKTWVYELAHYRNKRAFQESSNESSVQLGSRGGQSLIPRSILEKEPSAELALDQTDAAVLGPYDCLDALIYTAQNMGWKEDSAHVAQECVDALVKQGFAREYVVRITGMMGRSAYKRQQACPGAELPIII
ncbi:MAG: NAD(+) synthase [Coriobacteriia bacterium]|nr:NAD(+) synthase [Coriobacteriia bacterium]